MYDKGWAKIGWLIFFIGFVTLYTPMFYLGIQGMPRRYFDYLPKFHPGNILSSFGAMILIAGLAIIILNLIRSARYGPKAEMNPWGGTTLEWTIPSPPPQENFTEIPTVTDRPYHYSQM
jgi:cytochrome c oxidase subunit 1